EEQRVRVISDITSAHQLWKHLGDHYRVDVHFILWQGKNVLQVPSSALFRVGGRWAVFVVNGGRAQQRFVELGHRNGLAAQIIKGLKMGDTVIVHPSSAIQDGSRVRSQ
ncbi:efflux RND transporter periplasmic adaptor subunit, partial [Acidihalobacter prosperus]